MNDYNQIEFEADVQELFKLRKIDAENTCAMSAFKIVDQIQDLEKRLLNYLGIQVGKILNSDISISEVAEAQPTDKQEKDWLF